MNKEILLTIIVSVLSLSACRAQQISAVKKSTVSAKKETYAINRQEGSKLIQINNVKNTLYEKRTNPPKNSPIPENTDYKIDKNKIADVFKTVFPPTRLQEVSNDTRNMVIEFITTKSGEVKEIAFAIHPNTSSITSLEIEKLEKFLKEQIQITLNQRAYKSYDHVIVTRFVVFKRLLNNEPNAVD